MRLPPNPGSEGLKSPIGIDSDDDGVRDDIQLLIAKLEPTDKDKRSAWRQMAIALQYAIEFSDSRYGAGSQMEAFSNAYDCVSALYTEDHKQFYKHMDLLESMLTNTYKRARAYVKANAAVSGGTFSSEDDFRTCAFEVSSAKVPKK